MSIAIKPQHSAGLRFILSMAVAVILVSCSRSYKEPSFGGLNGRVQEVTTSHRMPQMWFAGNHGTDVMYMNKSVYDINGFEICSAVMDSIGRVQSEAESLFENGLCLRSVQRAGGKVLARLTLVTAENGLMEYSKEINGRIIRMVVRESRFGCRFKSVVTEDGTIVTESLIRTDIKGNPVYVRVMDHPTGLITEERNTFDKNHNIVEKHITRNDGSKEEVVYTEYFEFDEDGNWTEARTFNSYRFPVEVINREIKYWE